MSPKYLEESDINLIKLIYKSLTTNIRTKTNMTIEMIVLKDH